MNGGIILAPAFGKDIVDHGRKAGNRSTKWTRVASSPVPNKHLFSFLKTSEAGHFGTSLPTLVLESLTRVAHWAPPTALSSFSSPQLQAFPYLFHKPLSKIYKWYGQISHSNTTILSTDSVSCFPWCNNQVAWQKLFKEMRVCFGSSLKRRYSPSWWEIRMARV